MLETEGIVHGRHVELDVDSGLPDGARVRITLDSASLSEEEKLAAFELAFGACADDPSFAAAVAEAEEQRHKSSPREIDLDVAS